MGVHVCVCVCARARVHIHFMGTRIGNIINTYILSSYMYATTHTCMYSTVHTYLCIWDWEIETLVFIGYLETFARRTFVSWLLRWFFSLVFNMSTKTYHIAATRWVKWLHFVFVPLECNFNLKCQQLFCLKILHLFRISYSVLNLILFTR